MAGISRRMAVAGGMGWLIAASRLRGAEAAEADADLSVAKLLDDPDTPTGGNPAGDVTMVMFFDYNCPFCMKTQPELVKLLAEDPGIRLVYKDWPIFGAVSTYAAQLALAAQWQGKYVAVHDALMGTGRRKESNEQVRSIISDAGVDLAKLDTDFEEHAGDIEAILQRTDKQATKLDLPGTPVFLVGPFIVDRALDLNGFKKVVRDARRKQRKEPTSN